MTYIYQAFIIDKDTDEIVASAETLSQESLEEEMGKSKFKDAVKEYEKEKEIYKGSDEEEKDDDF